MAGHTPTAENLEKDAQIAQVVRMMAAGEYQGAATNAALMAEWGLTVDQVKLRVRFASYALRMMRRDGMDEWVETKLAELDAIKVGALARQRMVVDKQGGEHFYADPDFRSALQSIDMQLKCHLPTSKHSARGEQLPSESVYAKLSAQERIAAHKAAIEAEEARMRESQH